GGGDLGGRLPGAAETEGPEGNALPGGGRRPAQRGSPRLPSGGVHPERQRPGRPPRRRHAPAAHQISPSPRTDSLSEQPSLGRVVSAPERNRHRHFGPQRTPQSGR